MTHIIESTTMSRTERIREAARERWGDRWRIERSEYADGTVVPKAIRYMGRTGDDDGICVREEILFDADDKLAFYRREFRPENSLNRERVD